MDLNKKIYEWVEEKIGDKIDLEIEHSLLNKNKIDVDNLVRVIIDNDFSEKELLKFQAKFQSETYYDAAYSADDLGESLLASSLDFSAINLNGKAGSDSERAVQQLLQSFEILSPDEVICLPTYSATRKVLQDLILQSEETKSAIFGLQILRRLITSNSPKAVCEGFITLSENITQQIEAINSRANRVEAEELYDISGGKAVRRSSHRRRLDPPAENNAIEILTRSLYLLLAVQNGMPGTWLRFSEKKLLEIISSFIHMLSVSFPIERRNVSGFDLITVLQPRATWCRHWCHGSLGRGLLSQELRKNRRFFHALVDTVINGIPVLKQLYCLPSLAKKSDLDQEPTTAIGVPVRKLYSARFCHCFSMVTYIIQWRAGRALFPIQTASRRRPWTAQDIVGLMVEYVIHVDKHNNMYKPSYVHHMIGLGKVLLVIEGEISSARGLQKRSYR